MFELLSQSQIPGAVRKPGVKRAPKPETVDEKSGITQTNGIATCQSATISFGEVRMHSSISDLKVQPGEALHRQIANHIRALIYSGSLEPASKLPRMHDLAHVWKTNYFTVHTALTTLLHEGLLERKPRLGTFVRKRSDELRTVGIYYGDEILIKHERIFYRSLHMQLLGLLQQEGISSRVYIDCRPLGRKREPLVELSEALRDHAIQGLIVPLVTGPERKWLRNTPVPTSFFSSGLSMIHVDIRQMSQLALGALKKQGCKTVACITPDHRPTAAEKKGKGKVPVDDFVDIFLKCVEEAGLKTQKSWVRFPEVSQREQEMYGYREFHKLWSLKEKPDGLLVYPENVSRGVVLAALEMQVKVPSQLNLVLHKNQNVEFLCPIPANWVITREHDIAKALLQQMKDKFAGLEPRYYEILHEFIPASLHPLVDLTAVKK
ncbi:MAG: GntR family transcriptional regulator [Chthoniobacteraceae bacterium]